jgi:ribonuclease M5
MKIKEIIVVEGKSDTAVIKRAVNADTIETNGSEISVDTIKKIKLAQQIRGVIIFTDPDFPGEKIRKIISQEVSGCKHAFLPKHKAIARNDKGVGVEHANIHDIRDALSNIHEEDEGFVEEISWQDLVDAGLIGGPTARIRRERLGNLLNIGYNNGKQLFKRLKVFRVSKEEFIKAYELVLQEEQTN